MTIPPLHASQEKIKRAQSKLDNVKALVNGYIQSGPYSTRPQRHADFVYIIGRREKEPPEEIAWETVEAVGHLRSALDKMVVAFVIANGRGPSGAAFPFGGLDDKGEPNPFPDGRVEAGIKKKLTAEQWAFIETQRPYPGGNDTLWSVNEIANADKHRAGLVKVEPSFRQGVSFGMNRPGFSRGGLTIIGPTGVDFLLADKEREAVLLALGGGGFNEKIQHDITTDVVFGDLTPFQGCNVLMALNAQINLVQEIVLSGASLL